MAIKRITQRVNDATNQSNLVSVALVEALDLQDKINPSMSVSEVAEQLSDALITSGEVIIDSELSTTSTHPVQNKVITNALSGKQETLVSGTNIKTINNTSILGEGDITISGGEGVPVVEIGGSLNGSTLEVIDTLTITTEEYNKAISSNVSVAKVNIVNSSVNQPLYLQKMTDVINPEQYSVVVYTGVIEINSNEHYIIMLQVMGNNESHSVYSVATQIGGGSTSTSKVLDIGTLSGAITTGSTFTLDLDSTDPIYDPETIIKFTRGTSVYYAFPSMNLSSQDDRHSYSDGSITRHYVTNYGQPNSSAMDFKMFNFNIQTQSSTRAVLTTTFITYNMVQANPTLSGGETQLSSIKIGTTAYSIPSGGSGSGATIVEKTLSEWQTQENTKVATFSITASEFTDIVNSDNVILKATTSSGAITYYLNKLYQEVETANNLTHGQIFFGGTNTDSEMYAGMIGTEDGVNFMAMVGRITEHRTTLYKHTIEGNDGNSNSFILNVVFNDSSQFTQMSSVVSQMKSFYDFATINISSGAGGNDNDMPVLGVYIIGGGSSYNIVTLEQVMYQGTQSFDVTNWNITSDTVQAI